MNDLLDLVDHATVAAGWNTDRIVGAAVGAGRRRLRRRRLATAVASVAVLGVAGTGLSLVTQGGHGGGARVIDPAGRSTSTPSVTPSQVSPRRWQLAVTAHQVPATFQELMGGQVGSVPNKEMDDANPIIDFTWNGFAARVGLASDSYVTGKTVVDAKTRCETQGIGQPCLPGQVPGSFEQSMTWTGPATDGGVTTSDLVVYFAEGWDVTVMEANAAAFQDSPPLAPDVPMTMDQLHQVAYSDVWFD